MGSNSDCIGHYHVSLLAHAVNGGIGEDLLHAIAGIAERSNNLINLGVIRKVRFTQAYRAEYFLDLAGGKCSAVAELLAQRLRTVSGTCCG